MPRRPTISRTIKAAFVTALILDTLNNYSEKFNCIIPGTPKDPAYILPKVQELLDHRAGVAKFKAIQVLQVDYKQVTADMDALEFYNNPRTRINQINNIKGGI